MYEQQSFDWDSPVKTHKCCTKCGELKPLTDFYGSKGMRDGKRPDCKVCMRALVMNRYNQAGVKEQRSTQRKERYADPEHRAKIFADLAEYRSKPENAARARQRTKEWRSIPENKERHTKWAAEYHSVPENKERLRHAKLQWTRSNREAVASAKARRRANRLASPGTHTRKEVSDLLVQQRFCCANCEADLHMVKRHLDHWMPLIKGGSNSIENLQWLCATCNVKKGALDPIDWLVRLGRASRYPRE